ncbi:MAG: response regulator transcription factor [Ruminiclostridium sp.]
MTGKILIVEDDKEISRLLCEFLGEKGYETTACREGKSASDTMKKGGFDIILMDLMLPYKSGEELIKELRSYSDTPVIVLSAKSMLETRLEALRLGADDYILKPFDLNEVLVRIEVVLRRSKRGEHEKPEVLSCGELKVLPEENCAEYGGKPIPLTAKELQLLTLFLKYPAKVFTKANLYESVWNDIYYYEDNTINVHVSNLRAKLKKASGKDFIETVWGIGYRLKEEKN